MTTKEVAEKFYDYMTQGTFDKIFAELYSPEATSEETPGSGWGKANNLEEIHEKGKKWADNLETMYGGTTEKPVIAGNYFTCYMTMDFKPKDGERTQIEELGLYRVEDGKIVSEQFFYELK